MRECIKKEYERWLNIVGPTDAYNGKVTIGIHEVLKAHFLLIDFFDKTGEGIGGVGPKDLNLLHSALGRQFVQYGGSPKWNNRIQLCATLMFGIIKNHAFYDANKRTALLTVLLHLQKVGRTPTAPQIEFEDLTVDIANNNLEKYHWYRSIDNPSPDKEILTIAKFLRRKTRDIDLRSKLITYNELNTLLNTRGFCLENPSGNRINLMRHIEPISGKQLPRPMRIAHIGFHGWTRQVSEKDISIVRNATRLDAKHGIDSQSFYNGLDDPLTLIKKYREPLERLAFR